MKQRIKKFEDRIERSEGEIKAKHEKIEVAEKRVKEMEGKADVLLSELKNKVEAASGMSQSEAKQELIVSLEVAVCNLKRLGSLKSKKTWRRNGSNR